MDAYAKSTTPKHLKDEQETPREIFVRIENVLGVRFVFDVAASNKNNKTLLYWSKEDDALQFDWTEEIAQMTYRQYIPAPVAWMNPPYSMLPEFTAKAAEESRQGLIVVGLVPDIRSSGWYQKNVHNVASAVFLPDGRINFLLEGKVRGSNSLPSCFPVWTPWRCQTSYQYFTRKAQ